MLAGDGCWWSSNIRLSLSLSGSILFLKTFYSIAHYGVGRVFDTVAHIADAVRAIVEDSGLFEALDAVRAI
jgi:hypothetical protein